MRGLVVCLGLAMGCSGRRAELSVQQRAEGNYTLGKLGGAWEEQRSGGADRAWFNAVLSGTIYADSNCGRRFRDSPLEDLATHLTAGIAFGTPLREERLHLDNREALLRVYRGQLDGVGIQLGAVVLNKDGCTYDLLYLAPPTSFESGFEDFVAVISGFQAQR